MPSNEDIINMIRTGRRLSDMQSRPDYLTDIFSAVARGMNVDPEDVTVEVSNAEEGSQDYEEENLDQDSGDFKETDQIIKRLKLWVEGPDSE